MLRADTFRTVILASLGPVQTSDFYRCDIAAIVYLSALFLTEKTKKDMCLQRDRNDKSRSSASNLVVFSPCNNFNGKQRKVLV